MSETNRLAPGARIGDYVIDSELPTTASELAFLAHHVSLPRRARIVVAVSEQEARELREACLLEALRTPGVPRIYECGTLPDHRLWLAVEPIAGPTIAELIADRPLPVFAVVALLRDAAAILEHAHGRGIVHRAIRPGALVRTNEGLVITSWRDARLRDLSPPGLGSDGAAYRAPELAAGAAYDGRADVFALGAVAYEALALALPSGVSIGHRNSGTPEALVALIDRMLAQVPAARPSIAEVRGAAARIAEVVEVRLSFDALEDRVEEVEVELVELACEPSPVVASPPAAMPTLPLPTVPLPKVSLPAVPLPATSSSASSSASIPASTPPSSEAPPRRWTPVDGMLPPAPSPRPSRAAIPRRRT